MLCTATMSGRPREGIDFFPLMVDFEEKMYAAGKIPGGFFKREGRPSEKAVISGRQIDRPLRPLFPQGMRHEVQVVCTVLSADQENDPDVVGMIGASAALTISGIPWNGPIGGVRVGIMDDDFIVNPTLQELVDSKLNLVIAGTRDSIMMVEAASREVTNDQLLQALKIGHENIKKIVKMIDTLKAECGKETIEVPLCLPDETLGKFMHEHLYDDIAKAMRIIEKKQREEALNQVNREKAISILDGLDIPEKDHLMEILADDKNKDFEKVFKAIEEKELPRMIVVDNLRPDGRQHDEIRPITCEVAVLPRTHGSGLFTRGQTQVLSSVTLAPMSEGQTIDGLGIEEVKRYMHQYNFPPYSVGEVKFMRGPSRRDIGHGNLAERAVEPMIPDEDEFPYAIRIVSEVLESNGSSSMASICASTLSLMDAGVPLVKPVAGIAMGLIFHGDDFKVLTDIQGMEDALGEMDFKVAGTRDGITAMQMDIKVAGISIEIMRQAMDQAEKARLFILDKIHEILPEPRAELSPYAPRIFTMVIDPDKIREVIGPGGKIIHKIIDETGCKIDIENDGTIYIASNNLDMAEKAQKMIEVIISEPQVGEVYLGKVVRITDFGAFIELKPGKDGMIHISDMATGRVNKVTDVMKIGDEIPVEINEIDNLGRINLKNPDVEKERKALGIEKPERSRGGRSSGGPRRGGGGGRDRNRR